MALACAPGGSLTRVRCSPRRWPWPSRLPRRAPSVPEAPQRSARLDLSHPRMSARSPAPSAAGATCSVSGCCAYRVARRMRRPRGSCPRCSSRARASSGRSRRRASTTSRRRSRPACREPARRCCCSPTAARFGTARSAGRASASASRAVSASARACGAPVRLGWPRVTCRSSRPRTSTRTGRVTTRRPLRLACRVERQRRMSM